MGQLLNSQVGNELYAAYRYFALSAACQAKGLEGFAGRLMEQGNGEIAHMMKVYSYLVSTGANMVLPAIEAPVVDSSMDMLSMTRAILDQEMSVTAEWSAISKLAKAQDNAATQKLAQEFMAEQIEEENTALTLHQRVKLADSGSGILTIDADLKGAAVTAIESFKAKVRNDLIAEVTPAIKAELEIKAQAEANDKLDQRKQVRLMIDSFGKTRGADYFDKGMNFEQAMRADRDSLKAELGKAKAENAELVTKLQVALKNPIIPFEANSESQGSARVSQSDFDAYCKDRQITGAKKESLWKSMCEVKKQAKKEEEND
jgi:ferritin